MVCAGCLFLRAIQAKGTLSYMPLSKGLFAVGKSDERAAQGDAGQLLCRP